MPADGKIPDSQDMFDIPDDTVALILANLKKVIKKSYIQDHSRFYFITYISYDIDDMLELVAGFRTHVEDMEQTYRISLDIANHEYHCYLNEI